MKFADYKDDNKAIYRKKAVNSNFSISINERGVGILAGLKNRIMNDFELFSNSYDDGYSFECNSSIVNETFKGKETQIFKRIFINIDDCPKWSQSILYEVREKQLRGQKILKLTKKVFSPFNKK